MTQGERSARVSQPSPEPQGSHGPPNDASAAVFGICPYLIAEGAAWRSSTPRRDQRCGAVRPAVELQLSKQEQLCLTPAHDACATYRAATSLEQGSDASGLSGSLLWPATRSRPLVLEPARRLGLLAGLRRSRAAGQALLVGLMLVAFAIAVIARSSPGEPGSSQAGVLLTASPAAPTALATPASEPPTTPVEPTTSATSPASPAPTPTTAPPSATPRSTPTPAPSGTRQYKVKSGDTLSGIAAQFGTTVKVLKELNDIADARVIRVGQILIIP
jgi:LysM repeat protein